MISACSTIEANCIDLQFLGSDASENPKNRGRNLLPASPQATASKSSAPTTPELFLPDRMSEASTPTSSIAELEGKYIRKSSLGDERRRIWIHGPRPEYKKNSQRYNLPSRIIPLLRPNLDIVILPGGHVPTREFWEFCRITIGLEEWQALFTSGSVYNMDDNISDEMIEKLRAIMVGENCGWTLVPYCVTPNFKRWASLLVQGSGKDLDVQTFGDELDWVDRYGHKGALHRHMRSLETPRYRFHSFKYVRNLLLTMIF